MDKTVQVKIVYLTFTEYFTILEVSLSIQTNF